MLVVYTTCENMDEAKRLAKIIIDKKLAACVNFWPVDSMFIWKDRLQSVSEIKMSIKTTEQQRQAIEDIITVQHSYSVPMVAGMDVRRINRPFKEWMRAVMA